MYDSPVRKFSISPKTATGGTVSGSSIDTAGYNRIEATFANGTANSAVTAAKIEHSDDDSTWTTLHSFSTLPGATDSDKQLTATIIKNGGVKRYLRWLVTVGTDVTGTPIVGEFDLFAKGVAEYDTSYYGSLEHATINGS